MLAVIHLRDESFQRQVMFRKDGAAIGGAEPDQAPIARLRPVGDQLADQGGAHVTRRDHAGQTFLARQFVVGKARHAVQSGGVAVGADTILGEEERLRADIVPDLYVFQRKHFFAAHSRPMKRWSIWATTSFFWLWTVVRTVTKYIAPLRPVFS